MNIVKFQKVLRIKAIADSLGVDITDGGDLDPNVFKVFVDGQPLIYIDTLEELELYLLGYEHGVLRK